MNDIEVIRAEAVLPSLARVDAPTSKPIRVALVQHEWTADGGALEAWLDAALGRAAAEGARAVFLPELTLSRYPADRLPDHAPAVDAEPDDGRSYRFAAAAAERYGVYVHISFFRTASEAAPRGLNTSIVVAPDGQVVGMTNKLHIPVTAGYFEDHYFQPGPADGVRGGGPYPVYDLDGIDGAHLGLPTCWDEWFPEVARAYGLNGANIVVYPTAIGSEPDHPDFDTEPLWRQVIVGHGITNGLFMIVPNRTGSEQRPDGTPGNTFYGSSFISDPYGRIVVRAPRDRPAVLVADLDLAQSKDWIELFPFFATRRPDTYARLVEPVASSADR
ncbi:nitrilase-related carbon-nitrogen hydrolase [Gryllotalpicola reticulitermitis]|uniref:Nitrilase-related carbon-nitrogen hydrolase n=1 Tax=Gryllotalpicola reticulitermitis TaxID=1184153 RepID=A0ABV8QB60_9MICO